MVRGPAGDEVIRRTAPRSPTAQVERAVLEVARDGGGDRGGLLVDLLEHVGLVAALLGHLVVPRHDDLVALEGVAGGVDDVHGVGPTATISSSSMSLIRRVSPEKAVMEEARNVSPSPMPASSGHWWRVPTSMPGWSLCTAMKA